MKKLFAMLLTLALSLSLLAAAAPPRRNPPRPPITPPPPRRPPAGDAAPESGKKLQIGIVQVMEHPSPRPDPHLLFG